MSRFFIMTFCVFFSLSSIGQGVKAKVDEFVKEQQLDTFMVYSFPCSGDVRLRPDSCDVEDPLFLLWKAQNKYFIRKFDDCETNQSILLESLNPLRFYLSFRRIIDSEKIKPPTSYVLKRVRHKVDTSLETSMVDHSCYPTFELNIGKQHLTKSADMYDLETMKLDDGGENIYYSANNKTKFKELIDLTNECLTRLKAGG